MQVSKATPGPTAEPPLAEAGNSIPILAVIIPIFNEGENVVATYDALKAALADVNFELVFVDDDSTDGAREQLTLLARRDARVRVVHRIGRRGLSTAVTEGVLATTTPFVAVIDGDLQHDERILPEMLARVQSQAADVAVGSRYIPGGSVDGWDRNRLRGSVVATRLARLITKADLLDPMSGFFVISRPAFDGAVRNLSGQGYKILLDICASSERPLRVTEVAYQFRLRKAGQSKLDELVVWEYLLLIVDKVVGHIVPARFLSFTFIGGLGVLVHMTVLSSILGLGWSSFLIAQAIATGFAMVFNFFVNNTLTYRDRRLKGFPALAIGLATFVAACSVGAVANIGIANYLFSNHRYGWWSAGLAGILVGAVWNYAATSIFTWRSR